MATDIRAAGLALGPDPVMAFLGAGGVRTQFGIMLPPGGQVACYLRSTGVQDQDPPEIQNRLVTTLSDATRYARSGKGDTIIVLPGHSESVTDAAMLTNLVAGTRIIGVGWGGNYPTFTWTATGSQWLISVSDCIFAGLNLNLDGANGVVKAISVTAANNVFCGNRVRLAQGAALKATIGVEAGAGAGSFQFLNNDVRGTATHNVTDGVLIAAALANVRILNNVFIASATAANGLIRVSAAATELLISENVIYNTHTASTACIAFANVAADGIVRRNELATNSTGASVSGTEGIAFAGANVLAKCFQNFVANDKQTSGKLLPTVDT